MPGVRVFVGNVSADATETDLGEHFNKYNPTKIWYVANNKYPGCQTVHHRTQPHHHAANGPTAPHAGLQGSPLALPLLILTMSEMQTTP